MDKKTYHRWTIDEQEELLASIHRNGLEVATNNFSTEHGIPRAKVYTKAVDLKRNGLTKCASSNAASASPVPVYKQDKIIIMFDKETMPAVKLDFKRGKLIVEYDETRQLDIKIL